VEIIPVLPTAEKKKSRHISTDIWNFCVGLKNKLFYVFYPIMYRRTPVGKHLFEVSVPAAFLPLSTSIPLNIWQLTCRGTYFQL
jgi:hypothetical protein